jgi:hypothetical protein
MAKKIVRLTESDLTRLIKKVLKEQQNPSPIENIKKCFGGELPEPCTRIITTLINKGEPSVMDGMSCGMQIAQNGKKFYDCMSSQFPTFKSPVMY